MKMEMFSFVCNLCDKYPLMKKFLLLSFFTAAFFGFSGNASAQIKEPASISQKADDGVLMAYPNPAKDMIAFKTKDISLKVKMVTFYSILGNQVASYVINANRAEINIDRLKPGKYLIRYVLSDNTQKVTQIVKQ